MQASDCKAAVREAWRAVALAEPRECEVRIELGGAQSRFPGPLGRAALKSLQELRGTYYLNGLANCDQGGRLVHPFEAHGFVRSFQFHGDGTVTYRARFVETDCRKLEQAAGRPLFRGVFSNVVDFAPPLGLLNALSPRERNTANLACRMWPPPGAQKGDNSGRHPVLIACGDNDTPIAMDPAGLESLGPLALEGLGGQKWLAHSRYDTKKGHLHMCSASYVPHPTETLGTRFEFLEYDAGGDLVGRVVHEAGFVVMHDWTVTEHYYVVPRNPGRFNPPGLATYLAGLSQGTEVFKMAEDVPSGVLLIPRDGESGRAVQEIPADRFFNIFHLGPTYEAEGSSKLVMHFVGFDVYDFGGEMGFDVNEQDFDPIGWSAGERNPPPRLHRFEVDLNSGTMVERRRVSLLDTAGGGADVPVDMPTFHPLRDGLPARYGYFSGAYREEGWFPFHSLVKADLQTGEAQNWDAGASCVVSEPLLLPRGKGGTEWLGEEHEDDGWLASVVADGAEGCCRLVLLDAKAVAQGPVLELDLGDLVPWGVHSYWAPES